MEGKNLFFCCIVCAREYKTIVSEAKKRKGWNSVDGLEMRGDHRGRICRVTSGTDSCRFVVSFFNDGTLRTFLELD